MLLRRLTWLFLLSPGLVPLLAWPLPFQDSLGHQGVVGALHWSFYAPEKLDSVLTYQGLFGPNRFFYYLPLSLSWLFGPDLATRLAYAVGFASVAPLAKRGLRLAELDERWALAVPPIVLGRTLACGFIPNTVAFGMLAWVIGAAIAPTRSTRARALETFAAGGFCLGVHVFVGLAGAGFLLVAGLLDAATRKFRNALERCGAALFVVWLQFGPLAGPKKEGVAASGAKAIWDALNPPDLGRGARALEWSFAWLVHTSWDDVVHALWGLGLLASCLGLLVRWVVRSTRARPSLRDALPRLKLLAFASGTVVILTCVGENIGPPFNWWGGWLRAPAILSVVLVFAAAPSASASATRENTGALWLTVAAAVVFVGAISVQITRAAWIEYDGLYDVLEEAPEGKRVCGMWFAEEKATDGFPGAPHWYVGNAYMVFHGGNTAHNLLGDSAYPIYRGPIHYTQPGWGMGGGFDPRRHFEWCELYLVRIDPTRPDRPFDAVRRAHLELLDSSGMWKLYARKGPATPL